MANISWINKILCFKKRQQIPTESTSQAELLPIPQPKPDVSVKAAKSFSQIWTIENFATLIEDLGPGSSLESAQFTLDSTRFTVLLYPSGPNIDFQDYVSIYLDSEKSNLSIMCHFWVIGVGNQKLNGYKSIRKIARVHGRHEWIRKEDLLNPEKGFLVNGNLTIGYEVAILVNETVNSEFDVKDSGPNQILTNISDLWRMRHKYSDLVIQVSGGAEFRAHKAILVARSPVFAAMFRHKTTRESQESRIVIPDMSVQVCEFFLEYLYTGIVVLLKIYAQDLLPLADKYQIDHLKSICAQTLCCQITSENVGQMKLLAEQHYSKVLFDECNDFIKKREVKSVKTFVENPRNAEEIEKMLAKFDKDDDDDC